MVRAIRGVVVFIGAVEDLSATKTSTSPILTITPRAILHTYLHFPFVKGSNHILDAIGDISRGIIFQSKQISLKYQKYH